MNKNFRIVLENFDDEFEYTGDQLRKEVRDLFCSLIRYIQERENYLFRNYPITQNNVCSVFIYDLIKRLEKKGVDLSRSGNNTGDKLEVLLENNNIINRVFWFQKKPTIFKLVDTELLYGYKVVGNHSGSRPGEDFWEILLKNVEIMYKGSTDPDLYKDFLLTSVRLVKNRGFFGDSFRNEIDFIMEKCRDLDEKTRRIEEYLSYLKGYDIFNDILFGLIGEWLCWRKISNRKSWQKLLFMSDMGYIPDIRSDIQYKGTVVDVEKVSCMERSENNVYRYYVEVDETWLATFSCSVEDELNKILVSVPVLSGEISPIFIFEKRNDSQGLALQHYGVKTHPVVLKACIFSDQIKYQEEQESIWKKT